MKTLRHSLLAAAVLSTLMPAAVPAADTTKGRWINDGFGRAARDGRGSTCVSSGGDTHAFSRQDCDDAAAQRQTGAQGAAGDDVVDLVKSEPPAAKATAAEPARAKEPEPTPATTEADSPGENAAGTDGSGADAATAVDAGAANTADGDAGAAAAAGAAAGAAALAGSDDESKTDSTDSAADAGTTEPAASDSGATAEAASPAPDDPDYAPGSVVLEDRSPGIAPPATVTPEHKPVIDNRVPEFPVTKYTAEGAKAAEAAPAAPPAKKDAGPMQGDAGPQILKRTLNLEKSSLFNTNSAALRTDFVPVLDEVVTALKRAKSIAMITVTGHTDRSGSAEHNQRLSEQRAKAVRGYLVVKGIDPGKIVAVGKGSSDPVTKPADCAGLKGTALRKCYAPDRRVEITATGTKEDVVIRN